MDIQQAIHCLKNEYDGEACEDCDHHDRTHEKRADVARLAVAAIEKQIPERPKNKMALRDFAQKVYAYRGDCPACKMERLVSTNARYCPGCGQALDWEGR